MATEMCARCKLVEGQWSFKTERMKRKIRVCWDCLGLLERQCGVVNIYSIKIKL